MMNICLNAVEAMGEQGRLCIHTTVAHLTAPAARRFNLSDGDYVRLDITDDGPGMDPDTLAHAFEPFYTTKADSQGTGLGLAMVSGTAASHQGMASIDATVGIGTTVTLQKPYKRPELCIGCGICEKECPVLDDAAVYVTAIGETARKTARSY